MRTSWRAGHTYFPCACGGAALTVRRPAHVRPQVLTSDNGGYTKALGECTDGSDPVRGVTCMTGEGGAK
eukprot:COSAG01_NODE_4178_length_5265_cov_17.430649_1_plen_69_part_00